MEAEIEKGPDGEFRFVRRPSTKRSQRRSGWPWHGSRDKTSRKIKRQGKRVEQNRLSQRQVEHLIGIYAATGEGRGAFLAAKAAEEKEFGPSFHEDARHQAFGDMGRRRPRRYYFPPGRWGEGDSDHSDDDHGPGGPRPPQRPPRGPGPGPNSTFYSPRPVFYPRPARVYDDGVYDAYYPPPEPVQRQIVVQKERTQQTPSPEAGQRPILVQQERPQQTARVQEFERHRREYMRHYRPAEVPMASGALQDEAGSQAVGGGEGPGRPAAPRRRYRRAYVEDTSDIENEPVLYADLPERERDFRVVSESQRRHLAAAAQRIDRAERDVERHNIEQPQHGVHMRGAGIIDGDARVRDRAGSQLEFSAASDDDQYYGHLRGGAIWPPGPPTRTSSFGSGVVPEEEVSTEPTPIELYFYCANKGRIISSGKCENYTTFQELIDPPRGIIDRAQLSDAWFVEKLQLHYYLLNRQQQSFLWDLVSMKTIGFASFIRFERTVPRDQDPTGYIVTAKIPAIVAESQAESQFQYSLKHPLKTSKMMLYNLDCLAGTTNPRRPGFYVVEIKEAPATGKIYILLFLLILVSTGGGTAYAVVKGDPGTGLSIASYVLTVLSLTLALVAAGEWFGLKKPDSFAFAYSIEENQVLGASTMDKIVGRGYFG